MERNSMTQEDNLIVVKNLNHAYVAGKQALNNINLNLGLG